MAPTDPPRDDKKATFEQDAEERRKAALRQLAEQYDRRLAECFNSPDFGDRVDAIMDERGRTKKRPKAGQSY